MTRPAIPLTEHQLLPQEDYLRITRTIHSVLASEKSDLNSACLFYATAGVSILRRHYSLRAGVFAGAAFYRVGSSANDVLAFAVQSPQGGLTSSRHGFHAWIEVESHVVDFMAPFFPEVVEAAGSSTSCERRMLQKAVLDAKQSLQDLTHPGDFLYLPNDGLRNALLQSFLSPPAIPDLIEIATNWYRRPPEPMPGSIEVGNQQGSAKSVPLRNLEITGSW